VSLTPPRLRHVRPAPRVSVVQGLAVRAPPVPDLEALAGRVPSVLALEDPAQHPRPAYRWYRARGEPLVGSNPVVGGRELSRPPTPISLQFKKSTMTQRDCVTLFP